MKKILLTNFSITNYTGSEIDTISIAEIFLKKGYMVDIFTLEYGMPLINIIDKNINVYDCENIDKLSDFYDIIWAHHFPLLDYLLFFKKIKSNYVHYVSLSSYTPYESLPYYYKNLSLVSTISEESLNELKSNNFDISNINIFPNYCTKDYFETKKELGKLKKICIVSNHIPNEILEFTEIARKNNFMVDIYGMGYKYQLIDKNILKKYDLIISIGKTVNYALALGIPVYCYDRFGGDLYINEKNINNSFKYNFSGRYLHKKLTGIEIYDDIVNNYNNVITNQESLIEFAMNNFCLENNINNILTNLSKKQRFNLNKLFNDNKQFIKNNELFVMEISKKINIIKKVENNINYCQLYYDFGDGFSEKNSLIIQYNFKNNNRILIINLPPNVLNIRIDFCNKLFVYLKSIKINNQEYIKKNLFSNVIKYKKGLLSINNDPYLAINNVKDKKIIIEVDMIEIDSIEAINYIKEDVRKDERKIQNEMLQNYIKEINEKRIINRIKNGLFRKKSR